MTIEELYNELSRIKHQKIFTQREKERLTIDWVDKYAKENRISFDIALDNLSEYVDTKKKEE